MNNTKYYTPKTLAEDCALYLKGKGDKTLFKLRTIWKLASRNWELKRVSFKRYEKAKKLYNAVRKEWRLKDLELHFDQFDNDRSQRRANYYCDLDIAQINEIKRQAKALGLVVMCSTWAHIYTDKHGSEIM